MEQGLPWAWNEENQLCCCGFDTYCNMSPTIPASMPVAEGGALCMKGWGGVGSLELSGSTFTSNTTDSGYTQGGSGGAIYLDWLANELVIDDCYFEANSCAGPGGAIYNSRTTLGALRNCMFIENHAGTTGAAILWRGFNCDATMEDCLFDGNSSGHGLTNTWHYGAIHFDNSYTRVIATNCEFWNHDGYLDSVFEASGVGCNISLQDCFACNNRELFAPYDAHQVPYPWIDNGGNIIDDICPVHCPADTDGNGVVDVIDLLAVIDGWGTDSSDMNGDGTTDVLDLLAVIDGWGDCD